MSVLAASVLLMTTNRFQAQQPGTAGPVVQSRAPVQVQQSEPKVVRTDYDMGKVVLPSSLGEDELKGRQLFARECGICHDWPRGAPLAGGGGRGGPMGPWVDQETIKRVGEADVRAKIMTGSRQMPGFQYNLQPTQIDQIVAYLKTVTPDRKPAPRAGSGQQF
jgi:mono/diheme cytochrome c family protein